MRRGGSGGRLEALLGRRHRRTATEETDLFYAAAAVYPAGVEGWGVCGSTSRPRCVGHGAQVAVHALENVSKSAAAARGALSHVRLTSDLQQRADAGLTLLYSALYLLGARLRPPIQWR